MGRFQLSAFADEAAVSLDGQIEAMRKNRISLLELRGVDGINCADLNPSQTAQIIKKLKDAGISVWSLGSPIGKVSIRSPKQAEEDRFKKVLDNAVSLEARCIRLFSFFETKGDPVYRDEVLERLQRFADIASGSGVVLCHENEKGIYGDCEQRCAEIHRAIPSVRAVFDPANFIQCDRDVMKAYALLKEFIYYGHIKDARKDGTVVPAGEGEGHIGTYVPDLLKGGDLVLTLEPHLQDFVGLAGLETPGETSVIDNARFKSNDESFEYAVRALRELLSKAGQEEII